MVTDLPEPAELDRWLDVARRAAEQAVAITRETPLGSISTKKHQADVVTQVDTRVERAVRDLIAERLPDHTVVGEEFGGEPDGGPTWYCDPVDGTTNLAAGLPWTSFSLSLAIGRQPVIGVVADPWRNELMEAAIGRGTLIGGETPHLGPERDALAGNVVLTEWAAHVPYAGMLGLLAGLSERHCTSRVMGSGTLTLAHVAAGRGTGAEIGEFHPEDHLAACLLAHEAGLAVWDQSGHQQPFPTSGGIMVARKAVAEELFELCRTAISDGAGEPGWD